MLRRSSTRLPSVLLIDSHLTAATRLILGVSALLIIDFRTLTYFNSDASRLALMIFIGYSALLYLVAVRNDRLRKSIAKWAHWADLGWFTILLLLSGGANSIFFFGFLFAILVASFGWGFNAGLLATTLSMILFVTSSLVLSSVDPGGGFEVSRFLIRVLYLAVLGYLMAHWGGLKTKLNRQMSLLQMLTTSTSPRVGVNNLISSTIIQLRDFYDSETCLMIIEAFGTSDYALHTVRRHAADGTAEMQVAPIEIAQVLLESPDEQAIIFSEGFRGLLQVDYRYDIITRESVLKSDDTSRVVATFLDARSFVSIPLRHQNRILGRLYITSKHRRAFDPSDIHFLVQISDHLLPTIDSIRLVDRLASDAAEEERKRIARDIHDSIIQPYIGLQMGLAGVRQKLTLEEPEKIPRTNSPLDILREAAADTDRLIEMTAGGISDLRRYVNGLRPGGEPEDSLMASVKRFAEKFSSATNIEVQIRADSALRIDERLAAHIFQMIVEGLSNIRRHTESARAFIGLDCSDTDLVLRIENDGTRGQVPQLFSPRSIAERAETLGGRASVEIFGDRGTSVIVYLPAPSN